MPVTRIGPHQTCLLDIYNHRSLGMLKRYGHRLKSVLKFKQISKQIKLVFIKIHPYFYVYDKFC